MTKRVVVPVIGRAGLGNELFAFLRAVDRARATGAALIPPRWFQPRIGPTLRGEQDRRQYQLLFARPPLVLLVVREGLAVLRRVYRVAGRAIPPSIEVVKGMGGQFADLHRDGSWYLRRLEEFARPGVIRPPLAGQYLSVHIRLGDFGRGSADAGLDTPLTGPNTAAPLGWYVHWIRRASEAVPGLPIMVSSDGTDEQLLPVLALPGVQRSAAANALDEMVLLSRAEGIIGSRSTFSAWGAFLGSTPLLVPLGGDQYRPHARVWEAGSDGGHEFFNAVQS